MLIATVGTGVCFLFNAASFAPVVHSLMTLDRARAAPQSAHGRAPGQLREGLRYVRRTPTLATPLVMMALVGCLAYEFQVSLPVMAREGLHVGAAGYGFMTAAMGVGAVGGRPGGGGARAHGARAPDPRGGGVRGGAGAGGAGPEPPRGAARAGRGGVGEHLLHGHRQLDPAARGGAHDARARDVAVVRRLPGLHPDRGTDGGLVMAQAGARAGLGLGAVTCLLAALMGLMVARKLTPDSSLAGLLVTEPRGAPRPR